MHTDFVALASRCLSSLPHPLVVTDPCSACRVSQAGPVPDSHCGGWMIQTSQSESFPEIITVKREREREKERDAIVTGNWSCLSLPCGGGENRWTHLAGFFFFSFLKKCFWILKYTIFIYLCINIIHYRLYIMYRYIFIYLCIYKYINSQHSQEEKSVTQKHTGLTS